MNFDFSQTYLYKMHKLTNAIDALFDKELHRHADIGLSQFTLLLSVQQHRLSTHRQIASFLGISPGAISRQVEIAVSNKWIVVEYSPEDRRKQLLALTPHGEKMIERGIKALEQRAFLIFDEENTQTNLMHHIEMLQENVDTTLGK